jgi:hypothetical protein
VTNQGQHRKNTAKSRISGKLEQSDMELSFKDLGSKGEGEKGEAKKIILKLLCI